MAETLVEDDRTGMSIETLRRALADNLFYIQGKLPRLATRNDFYMALAYTVRDRLLHRWLNSLNTYQQKDVRIVSYLSAEFLMGPQLANNLVNMGITDLIRTATVESGLDLEDLIHHEEEPGLGNGGLGRLAACYLDSLATLEIPAIGYGIRYEFGIFDQEIKNGWQVEITDKWLRLGNPWEIMRPEATVQVKLGGHTEQHTDKEGRLRIRWVPDRVINGVPYDTPVPGYGHNTANTLRLWKAESRESFNFEAFNQGDYLGAVDDKVFSENVSKVLYPNDNISQGKQLRLEQQYFFVSSSLQDMIRIHLRAGNQISSFHKKFAVQLNDTHPSVSIAELMRLLIDEHELTWDTAWDITCKTFGYTNHTLMPEALERWPVGLFGQLLPRHLEIVYEINRRFLEEIKQRYPGDNALLSRLSIIDESGERYVRMAHLACVGSHSINGVAALHTQLLKQDVLKDFYKISPEKFSNKTNGVTPRRFMVVSNPALSDLITKRIGSRWISHLDELKKLEKDLGDKDFLHEWRKIKTAGKAALAHYVEEHTGVRFDPESMVSVQAKRIHEYKRQHLNVLNIITLYNRLKRNPAQNFHPRTFLFAGKAAPGYIMAKLMIKMVNSVAEVVNNDPDIAGRLKVAFIPDFNVKLGQRIYPAADLSEQISTAGKEASGTGNMKFSLNGALTIGTLDGANVEMREEIGAEHFFLFGLTADEVYATKAQGYHPYQYYESNQELRQVLDQLGSGVFSNGDTGLFRPMLDSLLQRDDFMLLADYQAYIDCEEVAHQAFSKQDEWTRDSIINVARMGKFSSDRSIQEYCDEIWNVHPVHIEIAEYKQADAMLKV